MVTKTTRPRTHTPTPRTTASPLSLDELVARFMTSCRHVSPRSGRRLSPKTLKYYQMCLDGLLYFAAQNDWPQPSDLTRDHLRDFMYYLDTEPNRWDGDGRRCTFKKASAATVYHYLKVAKTFFTWCQDEDYLKDSPALRLKLPSPNYKDVEPYTDDEISALLAVCERDIQRGNRYLGVRNKAIISVFVDTGLRLSELADMKLSELDPHLQQCRVLGKGSKFRVVPLNGQARKALKLYLTQFRPPGGDAVWLTDDGEPFSFHSIRTMIDRLKRRAGVRSGGSAHRFRHYFATRYLENGGDMNDLRMLLGHATLYMVLRYTRFVHSCSAINRSQECSPLDHLSHGAKGSHRDESWGWRG
jgi:site-specific recombinase XerD